MTSLPKLIYLMGSSGAGKDSIINRCRLRLQPEHRCLVAHRYITRSADAGGENFIELSLPEFRQRELMGAFAMHWEANGHQYGIGCELYKWREAGFHVIVNGSRAYLADAIGQFGAGLLPIHIQVSPDILKKRLLERGRESLEAVEKRIRRAAELSGIAGDQCLSLNNDGSLEQTVDALLAIIEQHSDRTIANKRN
jgi:ribose 1,5-bisphosphokinase